MTYMINKLVVYFCILLLCSSCNYISYSQIAPMVKTAVFGVDDIVIDDEYLKNKEYSFAKIKIGKSGIAISLCDVSNVNIIILPFLLSLLLQKEISFLISPNFKK